MEGDVDMNGIISSFLGCAFDTDVSMEGAPEGDGEEWRLPVNDRVVEEGLGDGFESTALESSRLSIKSRGSARG